MQKHGGVVLQLLQPALIYFPVHFKGQALVRKLARIGARKINGRSQLIGVEAQLAGSLSLSHLIQENVVNLGRSSLRLLIHRLVDSHSR